jgi:hypothetical protein
MMSISECVKKSRNMSCREASEYIKDMHDDLSKVDQYQFIHEYICSGGMLEPLYMAVGESHVKESNQYIIQKILNM